SKLDWDHNTSFDYYVDKSIGVVRNAIEQEEGGSNFLQEARRRLDSPQSREIALGFCDKLFKANRKVTTADSATFKAIAEALK
ncbi:MAG: hypothetical protein ABSE59_09950, partial [Opitutaceae bacterium]